MNPRYPCGHTAFREQRLQPLGHLSILLVYSVICYFDKLLKKSLHTIPKVLYLRSSMVKLDSYEQKLLEGWEEVAKKGQLTLWIMLALRDGPKHMTQIKAFINRATNGTISADDQSIYRALRRYSEADLVSFSSAPGKKGGPDLKIYDLAGSGHKVLSTFVDRNIVSIFFKDNVKELLK